MLIVANDGKEQVWNPLFFVCKIRDIIIHLRRSEVIKKRAAYAHSQGFKTSRT
jgi:hypothetical protein